MHSNEFAAVRSNPLTGQNGLFALRDFSPEDVISSFTAGETFARPTWLTLQIDDDRHITLLPVCLQYINHSCDPNTFFDTTRMVLVALKPIREGDEFSFFYPSTEWKMAQGFSCNCLSERCLGTIHGASEIKPEILSQYRLTDYIRGKLNRHSHPG